MSIVTPRRTASFVKVLLSQVEQLFSVNSVNTMQELVGPLQTALSLGLQYPPLAQAAMAALERWEVEQPQAIEAVAPHIVPLVDPYLAEIKDVAAAADAASADGESLYRYDMSS